ncbi:MAG: hypothetical protein V4662_24980 [Verrucomicrobiota bacterium]
MAKTHDILRDRLLRRAGLADPIKPKHQLADLEKSEWSPEFEQLMRNRLLMGALRYGVLEQKRRFGNKWDLMGAVKEKVKLYEDSGNTEYLVDIANYVLLEFECGHHPTKHFAALDNHHGHCRVKSQKTSASSC